MTRPSTPTLAETTPGALLLSHRFERSRMPETRTPASYTERAFVMSGEVGMVTTLTRADRCDRCGAAAQVRVEMTAGELLFCGHHFRAHQDCLPSQPTPSPRATTLQSE